MMHATWIPADQTKDRLDSRFYEPRFLEVERLLDSFHRQSTFERLRSESTPISYGVIKPEFVDDGVALIRNTDFDAPTVNVSKLVRIPCEQNEQFKRSKVEEGDLLVTIGGYVGTAAVVPESLVGSNINQHVARVALSSNKADAFFYWAFVESPSGSRLLDRWVSGTAQPGIRLTDLKHLEIPWPELSVQSAIGNKVRKSIRLRDYATHHAEDVRQQLHDLLGDLPQTRDGERRGWHVGAASMEKRLDAEFYLPDYERLIAQMRSACATQRLGDIESDGSYGILPSSDEYGTGTVRLVRGMDLNGKVVSKVPSDAPFVPDAYLGRNSARIFPNQVMLLIKGATIAASQSVGVVSADWDVPAIVNGSIYKFDVLEPNDPYFVAAFMGSPFGLNQKLRAIANTGIFYNDQESIRDFVIPTPPPHVQLAIGNSMRKASDYATESNELLRGALSDVERLISGELDEEVLLAEGNNIATWIKDQPSVVSAKN